jgi:hypothetical protein
MRGSKIENGRWPLTTGGTVKLTFLGSTSTGGSCPNLYKTDRGTYVVQGYVVDDPDALAALHARGLPAGETAVEIPAALLNFAPNGGA